MDKKAGIFVKITHVFLCTLCAFLFLFTSKVYAGSASLTIGSSTNSTFVEETITARLFVGTQSQAINAISAKISYPAAILELVSISKQGSIVQFWLQDPNTDIPGSVNLEGIIYNPGFNGENGLVLTLNFKAKATGIAKLSLNSAAVLANDGNGTNVLSKLQNTSITIDSKVIETEIVENVSPSSRPPRVVIQTTPITATTIVPSPTQITGSPISTTSPTPTLTISPTQTPQLVCSEKKTTDIPNAESKPDEILSIKNGVTLIFLIFLYTVLVFALVRRYMIKKHDMPVKTKTVKKTYLISESDSTDN